MRDRDRDVLERAVAAVAEQAAQADALIDELQAAGLPEDGPVLQATMLRLELLKVRPTWRPSSGGGCLTASGATGGSTGWQGSGSGQATGRTRSPHREIIRGF